MFCGDDGRWTAGIKTYNLNTRHICLHLCYKYRTTGDDERVGLGWDVRMDHEIPHGMGAIGLMVPQGVSSAAQGIYWEIGGCVHVDGRQMLVETTAISKLMKPQRSRNHLFSRILGWPTWLTRSCTCHKAHLTIADLQPIEVKSLTRSVHQHDSTVLQT